MDSQFYGFKLAYRDMNFYLNSSTSIRNWLARRKKKANTGTKMSIIIFEVILNIWSPKG